MRAWVRRRAFPLLVGAVGLAGVALVGWSLSQPADGVALAGFLIAGATSQLLLAQVRPGVALSLVNVVAFTAILLGGPQLAVPAVLASVLVGARTYVRPRWVRFAFNLGQLGLAAAAAGAVYELVAPSSATRLLGSGAINGLATPRGALALALTALVFTVLNFGLVAAVVCTKTGERVSGALRSTLPGIALQPLYLGLSVLAAVLVVDVHAAAVVLLVVPAIVARTGLVALQREAEAYDHLVLALVKLIEVKDGYTRGHAERVSLLAVELASELGYDFEHRRTTRYAALLHDVGKIAVPLGILRKPAALDDDEYTKVQTHPQVGVDLLADIDFLTDARPGILSHHERVDGRGYPHGLAGESIPELARIISVVDAFDAMTSTRAYRRALDVDTAVGRLHAAAGRQFDARMVEAFDRVLARVDWVPSDGGEDVEARAEQLVGQP